MSAQLSLAALPTASPRDLELAAREKRLRRIVRMVAKAQGEDDFWFDHIVTLEVARNLPGGGRVTAWRIDRSPRPRPFKRPPQRTLPRRLP